MNTLATTLRELGVDPANLELVRDDRNDCWSLVRLPRDGRDPFLIFPDSPGGNQLAAELATTISKARSVPAVPR